MIIAFIAACDANAFNDMTWHAYMQLKIPDICTRNFPWEHATTSSHELQNFEQKILYRVDTHARYTKKWVVGADFPLIEHTNLFFFALRKSTYDVFLTFPAALYFLPPWMQENFTS